MPFTQKIKRNCKLISKDFNVLYLDYGGVATEQLERSLLTGAECPRF